MIRDPSSSIPLYNENVTIIEQLSYNHDLVFYNLRTKTYAAFRSITVYLPQFTTLS